MKNKQRIFVAINLPSDIKKKLFLYSEKWSELPAKWTPKDNLHITLEFLGDVDDQELADICQAVGEIAKKHTSFSIGLQQVGYFPADKIPPKMIWATGEKSVELLALKRDLQDLLIGKVTILQEKGFTPHVTIAKIQDWAWRAINPEERPEIADSVNIEFMVSSIDVMESELKKGGPSYTIIESHELQD